MPLKSQKIPEKEEHEKKGLKQEMKIKDKGRKEKLRKGQGRTAAILTVESLVLIKYVYTRRLMSNREGITHPPVI